MAYAEAKPLDAAAIPVIDLAGLEAEPPEALARIGAELRRAAETIGFFYVRNHGLPPELIEQAFAIARDFFRRPLAEKQRVRINELHRGFLRVGEAKMYDGARADLKESFVWGLDVGEDDPDYLAGRALVGPNRWPDFLPEMRPVLVAYLEACNRLGWLLFQAFAAGLGVEPGTFIRSIAKPVTRASIIYYPPQPPELGSEQFGVAPHTDYGCLTLLNQDSVGGLQVRDRKGDWVTAQPIEGTLVVNVGDLMARWTNDRFASTPHRVVNASGRERFSIGVFVDPDYETPIEPVVLPGETARYAPTTCGDYILGRLDKAFAYRGKT